MNRFNKLIKEIKENDICIVIIQPFEQTQIDIAYYKISEFEKMSLDEKMNKRCMKVISVSNETTNEEIIKILVDSFKE